MHPRRIILAPTEKQEHCGFTPDDTDSVEFTPIQKTHLVAYFFGSDMSYLDENFNSGHDYVPKTRIDWSDGINELFTLRNLEGRLLYLPTDAELLLTERDERKAVDLLLRAHKDNHKHLEHIGRVFRHLISQIRQLSHPITMSLKAREDDDDDDDWTREVLERQNAKGPDLRPKPKSRRDVESSLLLQEDALNYYYSELEYALYRLRAIIM